MITRAEAPERIIRYWPEYFRAAPISRPPPLRRRLFGIAILRRFVLGIATGLPGVQLTPLEYCRRGGAAAACRRHPGISRLTISFPLPYRIIQQVDTIHVLPIILTAETEWEVRDDARHLETFAVFGPRAPCFHGADQPRLRQSRRHPDVPRGTGGS